MRHTRYRLRTLLSGRWLFPVRSTMASNDSDDKTKHDARRPRRPKQGRKAFGTILPRHGASPGSADAERIAKVIARAGLCSRRDAETWIAAGRVSVNGAVIASPALNVTRNDVISIDGKPLPARER